MLNNTYIDDINSDYCLKQIFSYIEYNHILKLLKINKKIKKRIGINTSNYQILTNCQYMQRIIKKYTRNQISISNRKIFKSNCRMSILLATFLEYDIMYCHILNFDRLFDDYSEYNIFLVVFIKIINYSIIPFIIFCIGAYLFLLCFLFKNYLSDTPSLKEKKTRIIKIVIIVFFIYQLLISIKLLIIRDNTFIFDIIFVIFNFLNIIMMFWLRFSFLKNSGKNIKVLTGTVLIKYKDIDINYYLLPNDFVKKTKNDKLKYISENANKFLFNHSKEQMNLIELINKFRTDNNIGELTVYEFNNLLPDFIINEPSELILFQYKSIFKLSKNKYLFIYPTGEFANKFKRNNPDILDILLNENLNRIIIIKKGYNEYILIYQYEMELNIEDNHFLLYTKDNDLLLEKKIPIGVVCEEIRYHE